ncbi:hypothetical protein BCV70DRAFT_200287 [Testicularia cyperi]|uniref:Redoxin domain-containing protein n=1 Tax=Testicularia cyperi TaxID=1882483 RepID=A0A317XPB7_9BASI|nr:hypothetical protein BCV70DRAFT_200287 [Testicularia cyperi]
MATEPAAQTMAGATSTEAVEDRAAFHLLGHPLPALIDLKSTSGGTVDLFTLSLSRPVMLFLYPRTGVPGQAPPAGWDAVAGATGCTPHMTAVASHLPTLLAKEPELKVFGLAINPPDYQAEAKERLKLPFDLLSDSELQLTKALDIPTFQLNGQSYFKRMTLLLRGGQITRLDYPIPRPDQAASRAMQLLRSEQELMDEVEARDAATAATANTNSTT